MERLKGMEVEMLPDELQASRPRTRASSAHKMQYFFLNVWQMLNEVSVVLCVSNISSVQAAFSRPEPFHTEYSCV